jgi:hypothetical protein
MTVATPALAVTLISPVGVPVVPYGITISFHAPFPDNCNATSSVPPVSQEIVTPAADDHSTSIM